MTPHVIALSAKHVVTTAETTLRCSSFMPVNVARDGLGRKGSDMLEPAARLTQRQSWDQEQVDALLLRSSTGSQFHIVAYR